MLADLRSVEFKFHQ